MAFGLASQARAKNSSLKRILCRALVKRSPGKHRYVHWPPRHNQGNVEQEGHDGPVSLHWLIREIPSYQTLQYLEIGLKCKTPNKD